MENYVVENITEITLGLLADVEDLVAIKVEPEIAPYVLPKGNGYFESSFPEYITSEDGIPVSCEVRVHLRTVSTSGSDGALIAKAISKADGTWRIDGLNANFKYDVICRHDGYNDLIYSNVAPLV